MRMRIANEKWYMNVCLHGVLGRCPYHFSVFFLDKSFSFWFSIEMKHWVEYRLMWSVCVRCAIDTCQMNFDWNINHWRVALFPTYNRKQYIFPFSYIESHFVHDSNFHFSGKTSNVYSFHQKASHTAQIPIPSSLIGTYTAIGSLSCVFFWMESWMCPKISLIDSPVITSRFPNIFHNFLIELLMNFSCFGFLSVSVLAIGSITL